MSKKVNRNNNKMEDNENKMNQKLMLKLQKNNNMNGGNIGSVQGSVYTGNMNERTFGCKQPDWSSKCT